MNEEQRQPETPETTFSVSEQKRCREIAQKYGWKLTQENGVVYTGAALLPWDCTYKGNVNFPKAPNDPELYEKDGEDNE